jgi:lipopolysaccharide/colanic/teichoic acid biosynthesis glycosyltransferase
MSLVGPRPEVRKYVDMYTEEQKKVLTVKPGITDVASIAYSNENEILSTYKNPEEGYIREVMPAKIKLNMQYITNRSFAKDIGVIAKTIRKIFITI